MLAKLRLYVEMLAKLRLYHLCQVCHLVHFGRATVTDFRLPRLSGLTLADGLSIGYTTLDYIVVTLVMS